MYGRGFSVLIALIFSYGASAQSESPEKLFEQAVRWHQAGDIDRAIPAYEKFLAQRPDFLMALSNLGAAYARVGRYQDAIGQYRHALNLDPANTQVQLNLALAYYKTSQMEIAAAILEKVHQAVPDQLQPALLLANCWLAMGKNKDVIRLLAPMAERSPGDLGTAYVLGTALVRDNQLARGQVLIERILHEGDSAEARLLVGMTKLKAQDFAGSLADLAKAIELNPNLPDVYSFYGRALQVAGDAAGAVEAFRKALAANPNDYDANLQLAVYSKEENKLDEARKYLDHALQVRPGDFGVRYEMASVAMRQNKPDTARAELESIVKESPDFVEAHVALATVYYRLKRKEDGDRERAIVQKLNAAAQDKQPGVNVK